MLQTKTKGWPNNGKIEA